MLLVSLKEFLVEYSPLFLSVLFVLIIGFTNGYIALQLGDMNFRKGKRKEGAEYKGFWHIGMGLVRLSFAISMLYQGLFYFLFYIITDFVFYDIAIDIVMDRFSCKATGVCEGGWDWDCIMLKIQDILTFHVKKIEITIPLLCIKLLFYIISLYFILSYIIK